MERPKNFKPEPFEYHEEVEIKIDTLTNLGIGLGRADGWVVMVAFALPGERVKTKIFRNHKNYSEGDLLEVLEVSPDRIKPMCPLFGECGGCQYQNLAYETQLEWKRKQVEEVFEKIGGLTATVNKTIASPKAYHYRSKLTPHFPKRREAGFPIGFLKQGQRSRLVDVPVCPIATEAINEALPGVREKVRSDEKGYKKGGTVLLRDTLGGVVTDNKLTVTEKVGEYLFQFRAGDFFQNNPLILPLMVGHVLKETKGEGVRYLVDAYCGVGVFGISGSELFDKCKGIEVSSSAVGWARKNAEVNEVSNCEFVVGEAESIFKGIGFEAEKTAVIVDPPRRGCDSIFIDQLVAFGPKRIVYVSCDPATQARDLKILIAGGYALKTVQPFDLFPQTRHIESVATLEKS